MHARTSPPKHDPVALVTDVCRIAGNPDFLASQREQSHADGLVAAVKSHDIGPLFDWLCRTFAYQGIADSVASGYLATHGSPRYEDLKRVFKARPWSCPKLRSFDDFRDCRFKKLARSCAEPRHLHKCVVPTIPGRKGILSEAAVSLFLFIRDVADNDLVGFIDRTIASVDAPGHPDLIARQRTALVESMLQVRGVSNKVLRMALSGLLLGCSEGRPGWLLVGGSMIVIDTLVHNFLHRTGVMDRIGVRHPFGDRCYRQGGCVDILDRIARAIDARQFNAGNPVYFPRLVQHALWAFCSLEGLAICNGVVIDDRSRCANRACPVHDRCDRVPLHPDR